MYRYERNRDEEREGAGNHEGGSRLRASPQMRELLAEKQQYTPPTKERDIHPARMRELAPGKAEQVPANSASVRNLFDTASARADHVPDLLSEIEGAACKDNAFPQVHAAALLVRDMSEVEYAVFRDDIAANGLREPIKVLDGEIIDGRNRMRACRETGTSPRFETVETDDPWGYVRSANIARRHLSVAERAMEAASVATRTRADRKKYNTGKSADVAAPTQEEAAKTYNVSERSVRKAKRIFDSGNLTVIEKVRSGEMSIHQGERRVKRIARDARAEDRRDAMERASVDVEIDIRHCSCADLRKAVDAGSVDLIVTDPPYSRSSPSGMAGTRRIRGPRPPAGRIPGVDVQQHIRSGIGSRPRGGGDADLAADGLRVARGKGIGPVRQTQLPVRGEVPDRRVERRADRARFVGFQPRASTLQVGPGQHAARVGAERRGDGRDLQALHEGRRHGRGRSVPRIGDNIRGGGGIQAIADDRLRHRRRPLPGRKQTAPLGERIVSTDGECVPVGVLPLRVVMAVTERGIRCSGRRVRQTGIRCHFAPGMPHRRESGGRGRL